MVSTSNLITELQKLANFKTDKSIVLKADTEVSHGMVIEIMDLLRQQGIYKIVVSTVKP